MSLLGFAVFVAFFVRQPCSPEAVLIRKQIWDEDYDRTRDVEKDRNYSVVEENSAT